MHILLPELLPMYINKLFQYEEYNILFPFAHPIFHVLPQYSPHTVHQPTDFVCYIGFLIEL